jgi:hypothetical protein
MNTDVAISGESSDRPLPQAPSIECVEVHLGLTKLTFMQLTINMLENIQLRDELETDRVGCQR